MSLRSTVISVMIQAIRSTATQVIRSFIEVERLRPSFTGADRYSHASEHKIANNLMYHLKKARPAYGWDIKTTQGSQCEHGADQTRKWIIRPLDSLRNFACGIPHFCMSISLEHNKEIVASVIYDPIRDELFAVEKGSGAWMIGSNNVRLRCSAQRDIGSAMIGCAPHALYSAIPSVKKIMEAYPFIRCYGSPILDMLYTACGRFDLSIILTADRQIINSGSLFIRESAGTVVNDAGSHHSLSSDVQLVYIANGTILSGIQL